MFLVENCFPVKSAIKGVLIARGYFQATSPPTLVPGQILEAYRGSERLGQVKFNGVISVRWSTPQSLLYHLSLTSDLSWSVLQESTLVPIEIAKIRIE